MSATQRAINLDGLYKELPTMQPVQEMMDQWAKQKRDVIDSCMPSYGCEDICDFLYIIVEEHPEITISELYNHIRHDTMSHRVKI